MHPELTYKKVNMLDRKIEKAPLYFPTMPPNSYLNPNHTLSPTNPLKERKIPAKMKTKIKRILGC